MPYKTLDPKKTYLVTGVAGFIGYYVAKRLLEQRCRVVGIDNLNDYYDMKLKETRLELLQPFEEFTFIKEDISDKAAITVITAMNFYHVCHLSMAIE
ncbi:GDP-mannose 4,6-dehydratase [Planococcus lenghuensis]|uniref:GDP-mannose 4,6-dehydratase n=1 Tax=Planococcus lenghuensis TaxID=2213202 RepID=UPI000987CE83|nr:GDP-mannose 4,6-dehydratase [Planococcus lenghuensis]